MEAPVTSPLRVCCAGDSFVAGVGDPVGAGWVGRLAGRSGVTAYNLGVRRDTSTDVRRRWEAECAARFPPGCDPRVVLAFGVNDATVEDGRPRTLPDDARENLRHLLGVARDRRWPALVVGPPPIDDEEHNVRIAAMDEAFGTVCADGRVPYLPVFARLVDDPVWRREVRDGDGAHPSAAGYDRLAALVEPAWAALLSGG